jgi:hypothetical protein
MTLAHVLVYWYMLAVHWQCVVLYGVLMCMIHVASYVAGSKQYDEDADVICNHFSEAF